MHRRKIPNAIRQPRTLFLVDTHARSVSESGKCQEITTTRAGKYRRANPSSPKNVDRASNIALHRNKHEGMMAAFTPARSLLVVVPVVQDQPQEEEDTKIHCVRSRCKAGSGPPEQ